MKTQPHTLRALLLGSLIALPLMSWSATPLQKEINDPAVPDFWYYENLESAMAAARVSGKPLLVTIRCVPCKACKGMDQQVVDPTDPELRKLMNQFVCVRLVQAWGLDLSLLQFDMNMSWAAFFMNADQVIYGRYGTRAAQRDDQAITVAGFTKALDAALDLHTKYLLFPEQTASALAGKRGPAPEWNRPDDIPSIQRTQRWGLPLAEMTGEKNASCIHCHFVPAAEMMSLMSVGKPITDRHLWAYPLPGDIGLHLDPIEKARVLRVSDDSAGGAAGFRPGDHILELDGQPILSIADVQWVLHQADDQDTVTALVRRGDVDMELSLKLSAGWRRQGEFTSRTSSWDLFKVKLLGINQLTTIPPEERKDLGLSANGTALRVEKLAPSWGGINNDARQAGLKEGDIILQVDGSSSIQNHSELLAYLVQSKHSGDTLQLQVQRDREAQSLAVPLNWSERIGALRSP